MEIRSLAAHLLCGPVPSRPRDWCWCWRMAQGLGTPCLNSAVSDGLAGCSVTAAGPRAAREAAVGRCLSSVLLGETSRPHSAHLPRNERHWGASRGRRSGSEGWPASRGAPLAARPLVKPSVASVKTGPMLTWTSVVRPTQPPCGVQPQPAPAPGWTRGGSVHRPLLLVQSAALPIVVHASVWDICHCPSSAGEALGSNDDNSTSAFCIRTWAQDPRPHRFA